MAAVYEVNACGCASVMMQWATGLPTSAGRKDCLRLHVPARQREETHSAGSLLLLGYASRDWRLEIPM